MSATVPSQEEFDALVARVADLEARLAAPPEPSEWMTIEAAAVYLGRSEDAVRKLLDRNGIDKHQETKGGTVTIRRADLDTYLNSNGRSTR